MSKPLITVLSAHRHPRLRYVLKELSKDVGYHFRLMTDREQWIDLAADAKVVYGKSTDEGDFAWPAHPLLQGAAAGAADLVVDSRGSLPYFFAAPGGGPDLLACIFYCLSRYEEYQPFEPDEHGRFPASQSHAQSNGYLERPIVREWAAELSRSLRERFPDLPPPKRHSFYFQPTYDIDLLWAWQHRGLRGIAAGIRDLITGYPSRALKRFTSPPEQDPFQTIAFIRSLHPYFDHAQQPRAHPQIFWLLSDSKDRHDTNPFPTPDAQKDLIRSLMDSCTIGIHPSYQSSQNPELIREEIARLKAITGLQPLHSRQHFLRFRIPDTYRELRLSGITNDHTMGYADAIGWRAGTNLPFKWYDLEREEATGLTIHPFAAMDGTLNKYLELDAAESQKRITALAKNLLTYGGPFPLLWHNSSFSPDYGWPGWKEMYEKLVAQLVLCQV